ncbi:hypothetical protein [Roseateles sp. P5_E7]
MRSMLTAWALGLCAFGVQAQTATDDRSGEATLACLVRPAAPTYPAKALALRTNGFYRVEVTFTHADGPPEFKVAFGAGSEELLHEAERYVRQLRLPCLASGQKVALLQEIRFSGIGDGDIATPAPLNLPRAPNARFSACLRSPPEGPKLSEPAQLQTFQRELKNGNLVIDLSFTAADQPPEVKVVYDTLNRRHHNDVLRHVEQYRVPCLGAGEHYAVRQTFHVGFSNNRQFAFKDVGIAKFLSTVKNLEARPVDFDLDTMGCPFRLRFELGRPAVRNRVTEVDARNPNRRGLIAWLEELELTLTPEEFESLLGAQRFIDVPCGTVKLG